ncbi:hypothetical protein K438DRAFT_123633 [Mycena galopus ATCC 62051]|nr:hypothetical protein K438DRAFT_123633 [Mycena galopus ATCC 62051]
MVLHIFMTLVPSSCGSWDAAATALSVRRGCGGYGFLDVWRYVAPWPHPSTSPPQILLTATSSRCPPTAVNPSPHPVLVPDLRPSVDAPHRTCDSLPPRFPAPSEARGEVEGWRLTVRHEHVQRGCRCGVAPAVASIGSLVHAARADLHIEIIACTRTRGVDMQFSAGEGAR